MARTYFAALAVLLILAGTASAVTLSNGYESSNSRHFSVVFDENAYSTQAFIRLQGNSKDVVGQYIPWVVVDGCGMRLSNGMWTDSDASDGMISSGGSMSKFGLSWAVTHTMVEDEATKTAYVTSRYSFSSIGDEALPAMRFFQYLDADVGPRYNNLLNVSTPDEPSPIAGSFDDQLFLLTFNPDLERGLFQADDGNATGWAASQYSSLKRMIDEGEYNAPPEGDPMDLVPSNHAFYGDLYGKRWVSNVTTALEWEIAGGESLAEIETSLGRKAWAIIPEPASLSLLALSIGSLAAYRRSRRSK